MKNIAIITGASSGMGAEFARQIADKNIYDEIWIIARRLDKLQELAKSINDTKNFNVIRAIPLDISNKEGINSLEDILESEKERLATIESSLQIGLLINNAGFGTYGPFAETSIKKQTEMVELNCTALTAICGISLPYLKKDSLIINTASIASFWPLGNFAVYGATKAYVLNFTLALRAELIDKGIKVCALCPGPVSTEFADVASNGARKEVRHGVDTKKVISHCIKKAFKGKKIIIYKLSWKFHPLVSRLFGRYLAARMTYKYAKRPRNPDEDMIKKTEELSIDDFI